MGGSYMKVTRYEVKRDGVYRGLFHGTPRQYERELEKRLGMEKAIYYVEAILRVHARVPSTNHIYPRIRHIPHRHFFTPYGIRQLKEDLDRWVESLEILGYEVITRELKVDVYDKDKVLFKDPYQVVVAIETE
jgi:hypothetical protein